MRLNPKNDFLFLRLFGEEEGKHLLVGLLNAVLHREGEQAITNIELAEDTRLAREVDSDKESILDIYCEIASQEKVNVEMQIRRFEHMNLRSLFYVGKLLTESLRHGQSYDALQRSIGINLLDHTYIPLEKYHTTFHLYEDAERHYMLSDVLELHFVEFPKFRKLPFRLEDPLHRWLRFMEQNTTQEQLEELMSVDELIKEAEARLTYLASDEETRLRYARREKFLHDQASLLHDAKTAGLKEGMEKGIELGQEQGIRDIAKNMLKEGIEISSVSKMTGLSVEKLLEMEDAKHK